MCINLKCDSLFLPSTHVEIKFLSLKLPQLLCIFKVIHTISLIIRALVQYWHVSFVHTPSFFCSKQPCGHCRNLYHDAATCEFLLNSPKMYLLQIWSHLFRLNQQTMGKPEEYKENHGCRKQIICWTSFHEAILTVNRTHTYAEISNLSKLNQNSFNNFSYVKKASIPFSSKLLLSSSWPSPKPSKYKKKKLKKFIYNFPFFHLVTSHYFSPTDAL